MATQPRFRSVFACLFAFCSLFAFRPSASAQTSSAAPSRITGAVDNSQLTRLKGNTYRLAKPQFDQGAAPASLPMNRMLLVLTRSPQQESALQQLMLAQMDETSSSYHAWLTPQQFGQQFGPSDQDIQTITSWLQSQGFQVARVSAGRTVIEFSGTAGTVESAFHTSIHKYAVSGVEHWANASDPSIPSALAGVVAGVDTLYNFPRKAANHHAGEFRRAKDTGKITAVKPNYTYPNPCDPTTSCEFGLGPYDFGTIYNVLPLWTAGINGTGETIAIVSETDINPQDFADFATIFGLSPRPTLNIIHDGPAPGIIGDEPEADIDTQWSGGVAIGATIDFVVSSSTNTSAGVDLSAEYIVDNNLAGVMSESYGECEAGLGSASNQFYNALWEQASAQGISVFISTGDNGAAGCDDSDAEEPAPALYGLQVSGLASTPYNIAVGGTDFNDVANPTTYWNSTNTSPNQASAKSYIPEMVWNDTCTNPEFGTPFFGYSTSAVTNCNNSIFSSIVGTVGGSGGKSACTTFDGSNVLQCTGGYAKPLWQTGTGVPSDSKRDIPDVSLFAGNNFNGSFYIICEADANGDGAPSCSLGGDYEDFQGYGGTSVATPAMAGIMALVEQKTGSRQGNANFVLYKLAAQAGASCNSSGTITSACIFYDTTNGTNAMACTPNSPNCPAPPSGNQYGVLSGYATTTGYDLATGLGSVNAANLVNQWSTVTTTFKPTTTTLMLTPTTNIAHGSAVTVKIGVTGTGTPSGDVSLVATNTTGNGIDQFTLASGAVNSTTDLLPGGSYSVKAHYAGDGTYAPSDSAGVPVTVNPEASTTTAQVLTADGNGNAIPFTSGPYGSFVYLRANVVGASGNGVATGNVTFKDNGTAISGNPFTLNAESYTITPNGVFTFAPGAHSFTAAYAGDASFNASASTAVAFTISQATPSISLGGLGQTNSYGQNLTGVAQLQVASCGNVPTGTVKFMSGTTQIGNPVTPSWSANSNTCLITAIASLTGSNAPLGQDTFTAVYSGDTNYAGATSTPVSSDVVVQSTLALTASSSTIQQGTSVTLTAKLTPQQNVTPTPTGTVQFSANGQSLGAAVAIANDQAMLVTTSLPAGTNETVQATYSGDTNFAQAVGTTTVTVNPGPQVAVTANPASITITSPGASGSSTITVTGSNGFSGTVSFAAVTCTGLPSESTCSVSPSSIPLTTSTSTGTATLTITTTAKSVSAPLGGPSSGGRPVVPGMPVRLALVALGILFVAVQAKRRRWNIIAGALSVAFLIVTVCCGGGGGGVGSTNPGTPVGTSTVSISGITATGGTVTGTPTVTLTVN